MQDDGNIFEDYSYLLNAADACVLLIDNIVKNGSSENAACELNIALQAIGLFLASLPTTLTQLKEQLARCLINVCEIVLGLQTRQQSPELVSLVSTIHSVC